MLYWPSQAETILHTPISLRISGYGSIPSLDVCLPPISTIQGTSLTSPISHLAVHWRLGCSRSLAPKIIGSLSLRPFGSEKLLQLLGRSTSSGRSLDPKEVPNGTARIAGSSFCLHNLAGQTEKQSNYPVYRQRLCRIQLSQRILSQNG